ncbi:MAG: tryptophan 2,3-dioxygenase [Phycisphaerales bacterium]
MPDPTTPTPSQPIYHSTHRTYGSYLKVPELLSLQLPAYADPRTGLGHRDELLFIIMHQVYELWFKQMLHEFDGVADYLSSDQPLRAAQLFERIHKIMHLVIEQLPLMETMFSTEFAKFRDALRPASGFQSVQFRKIEFTCGKKDPDMLKLVGDDSAARDEMAGFLDRPTPYDHFIRHLAREDHNVFNIPAEFLARDTSKPHTLNEALINSIETVYRKQDESHKGERYYPQFRVAEHLLEFDKCFQIWRFGHVKMVERMIGGIVGPAVQGTGGSSGARYLASTLMHPFWPDLWAVRARFGRG